eukprot:gene6785-13742_t
MRLAMLCRICPPRAFYSEMRPAAMAREKMFRHFSSEREPEYMVHAESDMEAEPKSVYIPILRETTKVELFKLHKEDPELWTVNNLSKKYGMTTERTKAVLFLMAKREEIMKEENVLNPPSEWLAICEKHKKDPVTFSKDALATEYNLSETEISDIISKIAKHERRLGLVQQNEDFWGTALQEFTEYGIDTNFRETPSATQTREYMPELFGDDGFEEAKNNLKKRIERETRAGQLKASSERSVLSNVFDTLDGVEASSETAPKDWAAEQTEKYKQRFYEHYNSVLVTKPDFEAVIKPSFCKWKFAFRDLSEAAAGDDRSAAGNRRQRRSKKKTNKIFDEDKAPTLICSRDGKLRPSNALEESGRSWSRKPKYLDIALYKSSPQFQALLDPDRDEHRVQEKILEKRAKRASFAAVAKA